MSAGGDARTSAPASPAGGTVTAVPPGGPASSVPPTAPAVPRRLRRGAWRSQVLAPAGEGVRRRGSDAVRVGVALVGVVVCWVFVATSNKANLSVSTFVSPPPNGVHWLVSSVWWLGSVGTIAVLALLALLAHRRGMARDLLLSGLGAYAATLALHLLWGAAGYQPTASQAHLGIDLSLPLARVAATVGVAAAALPYLRRSLQLAVKVTVLALAVAAAVQGSGTPLGLIASILLGWGVAALVHLIFGSPVGLPSRADVDLLLGELRVAAGDVTTKPRQVWGVARFAAADPRGRLDVSVYGRDAADAQLLSKAARFAFYRDSGPTLIVTREQQVEHEAYLTMLAGSAGARVAEVVVAGRAGPRRDAVLVTRPPEGTTLAALLERAAPPAADASPPAGSAGGDAASGDAASGNAGGTATAGAGGTVPDGGTPAKPEKLTGAEIAAREAAARAELDAHGVLGPGVLSDAALRSVLHQLAQLHRARVAHGAISPAAIVVAADGEAGLVDFRCASSSAPDERMTRDLAAALAVLALAAGTDRTLAAARAALDRDAVVAALPFLQRAALGPDASRALRGRKSVLTALREQGAAAFGEEVPALVEPRRISWATIILIIGTLIGGWALLLVLIDVSKSFDTLKGADWVWVGAVFVLAQLAYPAEAVCVVGSVLNPIPYGRAVALEVANTFVGLAAGSMGCLGTRVRFFQQEGYDATLAVSSGVLVSTVSWIVKGALFLVALPLAIGSMHFHEPTSTAGNDTKLVWLIVVAVVVVGVAAGLVLAVPRLRRLAVDKLRPKVSEVWGHLKVLSAHPRNLVEVFGGCMASQLFVAFALGAALHAFGEHLPLSTLLVVITLASVLGGISPVPGGMGVVEAGMILGLTAAGIPESQAVAATFVQRMFTSYLPPIWGWFVLVWMRKREYL